MAVYFIDDWRKYPNAVVHRTTKNTSFLKLAEKYKKMGIKNYYFHLVLLQPELAEVDPFDESLSDEVKTKIALECLSNPWYFLREVARVPPQGSAFPSPFRANRGNIALWWSFFVHIDPCLIQPRQTGKSVSVDELITYLLYIAATNSRINLLTKDAGLRASNVERLKEMRDYLPDYMQLRHKKDSDNTMEVECFIRKNTLSTAVSQASKSGAYNIGRGLTAPLAVIDEGPYCRNIETTLSVMLMSGNAARDEAKKHGMPYGTIFTTTAGPKNTPEGRYMYDLIHNGYAWNERLFDTKNEAHLRTVVTTAMRPGSKVLLNITLSHTQLGYSDDWMYEKISEANAKGESADRDLFNRWTDGDTSAPLTGDLLDRITKSLKEPLHIDISNEGYTMRWYIPEHRIEEVMADNCTVMALDMSEAVGRDYMTSVIMDEQTLEVYAVSSVNEANIIRYSNWITKLAEAYPNMILIPERKSSGFTLLDNLFIQMPLAGIDPFKRIYNLIVDDSAKYKEEYREMLTNFARRSDLYYDRMKKYFGFGTSGAGRHSRETLYGETLQAAARLGGDKCYDKKLIDELTGLEIRNGRIDHGSGSHDDTVVAWLLGVWMLTKSKNLSFYGLHKPLRKAKEYRAGVKQKEELSDYDLYEEEYQEKLRYDIEQLLGKLKGEKDDIMIRRYEHRLRSMESQLDHDMGDSLSIDELIREASVQRQQSSRMRQRNSNGMGGGYRLGY